MTIDLGQNLDDVEVEEMNTGGPMPLDDYYAFVDSAEEKKSQSSGNDMIELTLKLSGNPKYDGKLFWHYIVFGMEHSLESLKRTMTCLGMDTSITKVSADMFIGKTCRVHNKHEEYTGDMQDKVHYLKPDDRDAQDGSQAVSSDDSDPGPSDDDIPF